jgi:arsenite methyltransferase
VRWLASILVLLLAAPAAAQHGHGRGGGRGMARMLEDESRAAWQKPDEVVTALQIRPDEVIADIGAGTGYFTRRFAARAGKVFAVDVNAELLKRVEALKLPNVVPVVAAPDDPKLPAAGVDTIFFCNVLHHIEPRPPYYAKLRAALKPGGRIVVIDYHKRPLPVGPPPSMKLAEEEVRNEFEAAGFALDKKHDFLEHQYFLEFRPR